MRLRSLLLVLLGVIIGIVVYGWWTGGSIRRVVSGPNNAPVATTGAIDTSKARERGAEVGEKAAQAAATLKESVTETGITSKIKAKMALDDSVQARRIDVTTSGSTVTLTGTVRSNAERERALQLARETAGVTRVVDHLDVRQ